jgi:hypothetical protein
MRAFTLPTYGDNTDPFDHVRRFADLWNRRIASHLSLGQLLTLDEYMALWIGKQDKDATPGQGMSAWMFVVCKPRNRGLESHITADCDTRCIIFIEPYI